VADEAPDLDSVAAALQQVAPSGGVNFPRSVAAQRSEAEQTTDSVVADALRSVTGTTAPPAATSAEPNFLTQSWRSILDLPSTIAGNITAPHMPGSSAPQSVFTDRPDIPVQEPEILAGARRGVRDVWDTVAPTVVRGANWVTGADRVGAGVDIDAWRASNKAALDAWKAEHGNSTEAGVGRFLGQTVATAGPVARIGNLVARGATVLPSIVGDAARFLTGVTPATTIPRRALQLASQGAGIGGTQAALTSAGYDQPIGEQITTGAEGGAIAGPAIGGLTRGADMLRGYAGGVRPEIAGLADVARQYGVTPPVTALTSNQKLRQALDALQSLPGSGGDAAALAKQRQFQSAVTHQMGSGADNLAPATMTETATRLNRGYQNLYANAPPIAGGAPLVTDLANVGTDATRFLVGDARDHVGNAIREVTDAFQGGVLNPRAYKSLMGTNDGVLARIEDAAPSAAQPYLNRIRQAVQDRFAAAAGPDSAAELRNLDRQWRVMKTVQPMAEVSPLGDIGPGGLMQRVVNASRQFDGSTGGVAYTGGGPLGDLGRVGKQFFGHIPDSGTPARMQAYEFAKNPISTSIMSIPGLALGRPAQMWLNSPRIAGRMIDTSLGRPTPDVSRLLPYGLLGPVDQAREP
jgi:hypothetical protein